MTDDQLKRDIDAILAGCAPLPEKANQPRRESITLARLYHQADRQDWRRLDQHLEVVRRQFGKLHTYKITRTTYEFTGEAPGDGWRVPKTVQAIAGADIVLIGLSVDMQLVLQEHQDLSSTLLAKLRQVKQKKRAWGQPPYIAGIRMKEMLLDERDYSGMEFLPGYQNETLARQGHKDALCVEIARQVQEWMNQLADEANQQATEE